MSANLTPPTARDFPTTRFGQRQDQLVSWFEAERQAPRRRPAHPRRWSAVALAVVVAAAAAVLAVTPFFPASHEGPSSAGQYIHSIPRVSTRTQGHDLAASVLLGTARTAAHQRTPAPEPTDYIYTKSEAVYGEFDEGRDGPVAVAFRSHTIDSWIRPGGRGHYQDVEGHLVFPTAADAAYFYKHEALKLIDGHTGYTYFGPGSPNYNTVSELPTDPAQLKQVLETAAAQYGPRQNSEMFQMIADDLPWTGAPPAVRAALYTVASEIPGVVLLGDTKDQLGRPGTGVAYDFDGMRTELIFDPQTSGLLAEQTVVLEKSKYNPFPPGTVIEWTAYIASGIVHSDTAIVSTTP